MSTCCTSDINFSPSVFLHYHLPSSTVMIASEIFGVVTLFSNLSSYWCLIIPLQFNAFFSLAESLAVAFISFSSSLPEKMQLSSIRASFSSFHTDSIHHTLSVICQCCFIKWKKSKSQLVSTIKAPESFCFVNYYLIV